MRIGYVNGIIEDQLEASTAYSLNYPISNTVDDHMNTIYRSQQSGSLLISFREDTIVGAGNVASINASMCCINAHNMASGDTAVLKGYPTESSSTASVTYTFTYQKYGMAVIFDEADLYWEIELTVADPVDIGGLFLGTHLITPAYEIGAKTVWKTTDSYSKSESGQLYGDEGYYYRTANYLFPHITEDEKEDWLTFWETVGTIKAWYLLQYPEAQSIQPLMYCHFTSKDFKLEEHEGNRSVYKDVPVSVEEVF